MWQQSAIAQVVAVGAGPPPVASLFGLPGLTTVLMNAPAPAPRLGASR